MAGVVGIFSLVIINIITTKNKKAMYTDFDGKILTGGIVFDHVPQVEKEN
jgi:hypothetical protein